jgi:hypothetical protein
MHVRAFITDRGTRSNPMLARFAKTTGLEPGDL